MAAPLDDPGLNRARALARALDTAVRIPGTQLRFGLDPILGLVPGVGDVAGAVLSGYIVLTGVRLGAPASVVTRMIANVAIDSLVGSVPILGDLFDAGWKSNIRNVTLIERHVGIDDLPRASTRWRVVAGLIVLILVAAAGIALTIAVLRLLLGLFHVAG